MLRVRRWAIPACLVLVSSVPLVELTVPLVELTVPVVGLSVPLLGSSVPLARAESPAPSAASPAAAPPRAAAPLGEEVPRGAVERFLTACHAGDYASAARFLDLRKIPRTSRATRGPLLARELEAVLERSVPLDLALLSDASEGEPDDGLPPNRDLLAIIETENGAVELLLERVAVAGTPIWQVAGETVARIPALYVELGYGPFADRLPAPFVTLRFLGVRLWQWIGLLALAAAAATTAWLATRLATSLGGNPLRRAGLDPHVTANVVAPVRLLIAVAVAWAGLPFLTLALAPQRVVVAGGKALVIVALTWMLLRAIDVMSARTQTRMVARRQLIAVSIVPLGRRVVKILVAAFAVIVALQNFGFNVTGIAAGLGIGGLAIALAAQKTVENLFGGVSLIADQPVRVGDFCRFGDTEGIVEDIGLRSTRVRTRDRTVVTIPNAQFSAMPLENLSRRDRIPVRSTLVVNQPVDAARVRRVLERLRAMLAAQPEVEPTSVGARLTRITPQSVEIEIVAHVLTSRWSEYVEHREQILLGALDAMEASVPSDAMEDGAPPPATPS